MPPEPVRQPFPRRLSHDVPAWVKAGARFHIRIRARPIDDTSTLVSERIAKAILNSAQHYHEAFRWHLTLLLVMPDHIHALVSFPDDRAMTLTVSAWKRFLARAHGIAWQSNFFDHRIRNDREGAETFIYIMGNPAAKGLVRPGEPWPWTWCPGT